MAAVRGLALLPLEACRCSPRGAGWQAPRAAAVAAAAAARQRCHCAAASAAHAARPQQTRGCAAAAGDTSAAPLCSSTALVATSEAGTRRLAAAFAAHLRPGDAYLLRGSVGAGKSAFCRAFIRAAADDPWLTVPSPTFLLQQVYEDHGGPPIHHFDLYRLEGGGDVGRLELPASFERAVSLLEWPERLPAEVLPARRLEVAVEIVIDEAEQRRLEEQRQMAQAEESPSAGAAHVSSSSSRSEEWEAGEEDEDDGDENNPYTDRRWRRITLHAHGTDWEERLGRVAHAAARGALSRGVFLAEQASAAAGAGAAAAPGDR